MHEIVKILELSAIPVSGGSDSIRWRIEVVKDLRRPDCHRARLLRWDTYRVLPSFGGRDKTELADEELLVVDPLWDWMDATAPSARDALELVLARLREQLPGAEIPRATLVDW